MKNFSFKICICDVIGATLSGPTRQPGAARPQIGDAESTRPDARPQNLAPRSLALNFFRVASASLKFRDIP